MREQIGVVRRAVREAAFEQITENIILFDPHIVEGERSGVGAAPAELVLMRRDFKARIIALDNHAAIAFGAVARAGFAHNEPGHRRALRAIEFGTIEPVAVICALHRE